MLRNYPETRTKASNGKCGEKLRKNGKVNLNIFSEEIIDKIFEFLYAG